MAVYRSENHSSNWLVHTGLAVSKGNTTCSNSWLQLVWRNLCIVKALFPSEGKGHDDDVEFVHGVIKTITVK